MEKRMISKDDGDLFLLSAGDIEGEDEQRKVMTEIFALPVECRIILLARHYMEFSYSEIASVLDTSPKRAQVCVVIAEMMFKRRLEKQFDGRLPYITCKDNVLALGPLYQKEAETVMTPDLLNRLNLFSQHAVYA